MGPIITHTYSLEGEFGQETAHRMREAMRLLMLLTDEQRGRLFCWFCQGCCRYVGPGDCCYCQRDD